MRRPGSDRAGRSAAWAPWAGVLLLFLAGAILAPPAPAWAASAVTKREAKVAKTTIEPGGYERVVVLLSDRREYKYYRFSAATPLTLEISGPTTLSVMIRLLFDQTMKGTQDFSVRVEEGGPLGSVKESGVHSLKAHKSTVATLKDESALVPSKAETLDIAVPGGKHSYRLVLGAGPKTGAIVRVQMPTKDLVAGTQRSEGGR